MDTVASSRSRSVHRSDRTAHATPASRRVQPSSVRSYSTPAMARQRGAFEWPDCFPPRAAELEKSRVVATAPTNARGAIELGSMSRLRIRASRRPRRSRSEEPRNQACFRGSAGSERGTVRVARIVRAMRHGLSGTRKDLRLPRSHAPHSSPLHEGTTRGLRGIAMTWRCGRWRRAVRDDLGVVGRPGLVRESQNESSSSCSCGVSHALPSATDSRMPSRRNRAASRS